MALPPDLRARVDQLLAAKTGVASALVDLDANPAKLSADPALLTGTSAEAMRSAQDKLAETWKQFSVLSAQTDRIEELRAKAGGGLLDPKPVLPLLETALVDGRNAEQLAASLAGSIRQIEAAFESIEAARGLLGPRVERLQAAAVALRPVAEALNDSQAELDRITTRVAALGDKVRSDPLGIDGTALVALEGNVASLEQSLRALARRRDGLADDLVAADAELDALLSTIAKGIAIAARTATRLSPDPTSPQPLSLELVTGSGGFRTRLSAVANDDPDAWRRRSRDLELLRKEVEAAAASAHQVVLVHTARMEQRDRLRGRFDAYRSKAAATGRAEDTDVAALQAETQRVLHEAPVDLAAAEKTLARYADALARTNPAPSASSDAMKPTTEAPGGTTR